MKKTLLLLSGLLLLLATSGALAQETPAQRDARMKWWREAKFGLFIHWGVYAVPAGFYKHEPVQGNGEWIMLRGQIPVAEYRAFAKEFNPVKYNPEAWAKLAKEAGMKYIVITAKHHDGFALFPSEASKWNVADATPYKKDLITPLAKAARHQGLKFGTYYSQAQDWNNPGGAKSRYKEGEAWDDAQKGSFDDYLKNVSAPQVREILTRIKPDVFWWDTPSWMNAERAKPLNDLLALRPGLISNNRLGGGYRGDTETPEQHIPATGFKDRDWETCMTMNGTWGFKSADTNWKSTETLLHNLIDIVSKGGNYLLNVGPTALGEIPEPSVQRLKEIGAWLRVNGDSIYGTTASPFWKLAWGRSTKKVSAKGGTLYLQVFDWPQDGKLVVPGLQSRVTKARLLATGKQLPFTSENGDLVLTLPACAPDHLASVIAVTFKGPLSVERRLPGPSADGTIRLDAQLADIHNNLRARAELRGKGPAATISHWDNPQSTVSWDFNAPKAGAFAVKADINGAGGGKLALALGKVSVPAEVPSADSDAARTVELGRLSIPAPGDCTLELNPNTNNWKGFELRQLSLTPVPR